MGNDIHRYEVVVIGAGHAGCEAALASARLGCKTLVITMSLDSIAMMPCNPAIGGTSKGHLVREVDALGGEIGKNIDNTFIQSRMLNIGKGPAVYSLRAQADKWKYQHEMKKTLEKQNNLDIKQDEVISLLVENNEVEGVKTRNGANIYARTVILTTGTYLKGRIIIGQVNYSGGPNGLFPSLHLSEDLLRLGIRTMRFKTGTPARVNKRTINFDKMVIQPGDKKISSFSFTTQNIEREQVPCWLTYTNENTHEVIRKNLDKSPLFTGMIEGTGTRYCPSIEDKVVRFSDKERHQVFIEPEGEDTCEMYVQGMSSSLPEEVQLQMLRTIEGLEEVQMMRTGYAIEYECIDPTQLMLSLETKNIKGLFSAGQINGSSGYEEAAAQGIIAGINAAMKIKGRGPLILDRADAYIGVLIDDLVTKGTNEPYRMMTSRAEYRLLLRQDNADLRLTQKGYEMGLIEEDRYRKMEDKRIKIEELIKYMKKQILSPNDKTQTILEENGSTKLKSGISIYELLKRPEIDHGIISLLDNRINEVEDEIREQAQIQIKYEGYISRQLRQVQQFKRIEGKTIGEGIEYSKINGLRIEAVQKLSSIRPSSIGQASRISGVSPADISVLMVYLEKVRRSNNE